MLVISDFFTLFYAGISRIAVNHLIIFPYQLTRLCDVVNICGRCGYCMYNIRSTFHAEFSFVSLLGLVHFRTPFLFGVLDGTGGIYDSCINNCATVHDMFCCFHHMIDCLEKFFPEMIFFNHMTEFQKCCCIGNLFAYEIYFHKFAECIAVIDCVLNAFVREVEPYLESDNFEHFFYSLCRSATLSRWIIWAHKFHPFFPWDNFFHDVKKFFSLCDTLSVILYITECGLLHDFFLTDFCGFSISSIIPHFWSVWVDLISESLDFLMYLLILWSSNCVRLIISKNFNR